MTDFDITFIIYNLDADKSSLTGLNSQFAINKHPNTGSKIEGQKWGQSFWPDPKISDSYDFFGAIFDATDSGLDSNYILNGIGNRNDLKLLEISGEDNVHTPILNHGYYYIDDQEWYMLGDGYYSQIVPYTNIYSGLMFEVLDYNPKPTIPLNIKIYEWDQHQKRYKIHTSFRRKVEFTGTLISGEELSTVNDDGLIELQNIDASHPEYITLGTRDDGRTIYFNENYSQYLTSGMDFLYSGEDAGIYHTRYSPVDLTGTFNLYVDSGIYIPEIWTRIDSSASFTKGPSKEYKLDPILGTVEFGSYPPGSGLVPLENWSITADYYNTPLIEYELENGADTIHADISVGLIDHNTSNGFLEVKD